MAIINGLTAEAMQAIRDGVIVDANVVGGNLILTRYDAAEIDAGSVIGPTGAPGVSEPELDDALAAAMLGAMPVGTIVDYIATVAPTNWALINGQTIVSAQSLYPAFWALAPTGWRSGSNLIMPDARRRVSLAFDATDSEFENIGNIGGERTHDLTIPELPSHTHPMTHKHANGGIRTDDDAKPVYSTGSGTGGPATPSTSVSFPDSGAASDVKVVYADVPQWSGSSGGTGGGTAMNNMQPFIVFQKIVKLV